jgi:hypothetical protein
MLSEGSSNVSGSFKILQVDSNLTEFEAECTRNGFSHYPSHSMRLQIGNYGSLYPNAVIYPAFAGIWDASEHAGTAEWAGGPINWEKEPAHKVTATVKSITVECSSA